MTIGDSSYDLWDGSQISMLHVAVPRDFITRIQEYSNADNRSIGLLVIEACEQMMHRYKKGKVDSLEKRVNQLIDELTKVLEI